MRTLLAAVALLLLVAPGCGDDTTSTPDLSVPKDMTVVHDMRTYLCGAALSCGTACFTGTGDQLTCAQSCAAGLNSVSSAKFQALVGCIFAACSVDGGDVTIECAAPKIMQGGACFAQAGACQGDTGK
jgi:hypothetical protein